MFPSDKVFSPWWYIPLPFRRLPIPSGAPNLLKSIIFSPCPWCLQPSVECLQAQLVFPSVLPDLPSGITWIPSPPYILPSVGFIILMPSSVLKSLPYLKVYCVAFIPSDFLAFRVPWSSPHWTYRLRLTSQYLNTKALFAPHWSSSLIPSVSFLVA